MPQQLLDYLDNLTGQDYNPSQNSLIWQAAQRFAPAAGVDPTVFANTLGALIKTEDSGQFQPSPAGAYGVTQAMPNWYRQVGGDPNDLGTQINAGGAALQAKFQAQGPNPADAAAGYFGISSKPDAGGMTTPVYKQRFQQNYEGMNVAPAPPTPSPSDEEPPIPPDVLQEGADATGAYSQAIAPLTGPGYAGSPGAGGGGGGQQPMSDAEAFARALGIDPALLGGGTRYGYTNQYGAPSTTYGAPRTDTSYSYPTTYGAPSYQYGGPRTDTTTSNPLTIGAPSYSFGGQRTDTTYSNPLTVGGEQYQIHAPGEHMQTTYETHAPGEHMQPTYSPHAEGEQPTYHAPGEHIQVDQHTAFEHWNPVTNTIEIWAPRYDYSTHMSETLGGRGTAGGMGGGVPQFNAAPPPMGPLHYGGETMQQSYQGGAGNLLGALAGVIPQLGQSPTRNLLRQFVQ